MVASIYVKHPDVNSISLEYSKFLYLVNEIWRIDRRHLLEWFTIKRGIPVVEDIPLEFKGSPAFITDNPIWLGPSRSSIVHVKFGEETHVYGVCGESTELEGSERGGHVWYYIHKDTDKAPFSMYDKFVLKSGMIQNYSSGSDILTDVGKFFLNTILLVKPFGDKVPYINERFNPSKLDDIVAKLVKDDIIGSKEYYTYMNWGYWYGNDGTIATPIWTRKALTTDPNIKKRKAELLEKHRHELHDPIVMMSIEQELIQMDKDWVKDDPVANYFEAAGSATYNDIRKKIYITVGVSIAFDKNTGSYEITEESLAEGWSKQSVAVMSNDIRRGTYGRGKKTAEGGSLTKETGRIFQGVSITEYDCRSRKGIAISLTKENCMEYDLRVLTDGTILTAKNMSQYVGKTVQMRGPQRCITKNGYCDCCCGLQYKRAGITKIGIQIIDVTSDFVLVSMKSMHKSSASSKQLDDVSKYFR